ncbi:efflux RND transporter permease subunit [Natranaerobius trueperi]|uniref:Acriflavin resistance protein n=1 Tax=Natranaerobius trueperi TaxID=759412 RepID=A0A226BVS9_9FIRM|nr:efflux RND transporter permease subunit [Natranaerobius trueperi]OWZ83001.1 acriflavin resistance protein [Natranaerobius trueperi]
MNVAKFGIKRPITILMIITAVLLIGFISVSETPIDLYPDIDLPALMIRTEYEGAGPEKVENMVTNHLEEALATVEGIDTIMSTSRPGESEIIARFDWGTDMDFASLEAREMVDMVMEQLPDDVGNPVVMQLDPDMLPVVQAGIYGDLNDQEMTEMAEDMIQSQIEGIEGVALVDVSGGVEREIQIKVDPYKLSSYGISIEDLGELIYASNVDMSGGDVLDGGREYLIEVEGELDSVEELEDLIIGEDGKTPVRLGEVAEVNDVLEQQEPITRLNEESTVSLGVRKESEANTVQVANEVKEEFDQLEEELPGNIKFDIAMDQSEFIERSISNLINMGLSGAVIAMFMLWLFLGNLRSTIIIGIAIPVSIIGTFNLLYFRDYTLNFITLGGLALGIGMMVDSAIVVLENIFRKREEGYTPVDSAVLGSKEVTGAIIAATITSVSAFLPIVFVEGISSILFAPLAWTVTFALVASLIVAAGVIPLMTVKFIGPDVDVTERTSKIPKKFDVFIEFITSQYEKIIKWGLSNRKIIGMIFIAVLLSTVFIVPLVGFEFLPPMDTGEITVNIETPVGSPTSYTDEVVRDFEEMLTDIPEVETVFSNIGDGGVLADSGSNIGRIDVLLEDEGDREREVFDVAEEIRKGHPQVPGVSVTVVEQDLSGGAVGLDDDIQISIRGDDTKVLEDLTSELADIVDEVPGTREVSTSFDDLAPQLSAKMNRDQAFTYGLTPYHVGSFLNIALDGQLVSLYEEDGEEYDIQLMMEHPRGWDLTTLESLLIQTPKEELVPLHEITDLEIGEAPRDIKRENQVRAGTISGQVADRDLGSVMNDIQDELEDKDLPSGYFIEYRGIYRDMMEAFDELTMALVLAVVLVYMVMAAQFESLLYPFIIMFTLPQTMIGVVLALLISGRTFSIVAFIGVIMLAGIVVNNGIVMVDYINLLYRERNYSRYDAVLEAGKKRLRPILMTTSTTILGMLPLALGIGEGAETSAPMATVTVGGLAVSTLLTLIVIPVIYTILDDFGNWFGSKFSNKTETVSEQSG